MLMSATVLKDHFARYHAYRDASSRRYGDRDTAQRQRSLFGEFVKLHSQSVRHGLPVSDAGIPLAVQIFIDAVLSNPGHGDPLPSCPSLPLQDRQHDGLALLSKRAFNRSSAVPGNNKDAATTAAIPAAVDRNIATTPTVLGLCPISPITNPRNKSQLCPTH